MMRRFRGNSDWRSSVFLDYAIAFVFVTTAVAAILYFWGP